MRYIKFLLFLAIFLKANMININFQNLDIQDFIRMVAKITNKNILLPNDIRGKVNFISVKPIEKKEIYPILVNILRSKGYTIIEDKGFLKVVRSVEATRNAPPLANYNNIYQMETTVISLQNIPVRDAYSQVRYLLSRYGRIVVNRNKNILIITDYPDNVSLIKAILKRLDSFGKKEIKIFHLENTQVDKLFPKINEIANNLFPKIQNKFKIVKDENTNSLILIGDNSVLTKLISIILALDKKPKPINQITEVITLKNSDAVKITQILRKVLKSKFKNSLSLSLTADKETNSIIVLATPQEIELIKNLISKLDIPKMQVYVKAKILEISNTKAAEIGSKLGIWGGSATTNGIYTLSANLGGPALAFDPKDLGLSLPTIKEGLALGATLDLLETYGAAKKLSEPSILCINNTPSTIYVGKTVSVITGKTTSTVTSESYSREDIGLTLKVTPRIDSDNKVSLKVEANVEDILPGSQIGLPITSKREIKTTSIVKNGQSIIIGGLVRDNDDLTLTKVPLLGDIPLIGELFKHRQKNKDKTTLVIMLTPYIVKRSEDLDKLRVTLAKLSALEERFVNKIKKTKLLHINKQHNNKSLYDFIRN